MTRHAIYRGKVVTPEEFMALAGPDYRKAGRYPTCPACRGRLEPYGVHSTTVPSRFDHPNGSDCPLSSTPDKRYAHLSPQAWDPDTGARLFAEFCQPENLKSAYMVSKGILYHLSGLEFQRLCFQAIRWNIFAYRGITLDVLPYILVTLADLPEDNGRKHPTRVVLSKPKGPIDMLWLSPDQCSLRFYFADSGNPMRKQPLPIPYPEAEAYRDDTAWIGKGLYKMLEECCKKHRQTSASG